MTAKKTTAHKTSAGKSAATAAGPKGPIRPINSAQERAAMKEYIAEQRRQAADSDGEAGIREKLARISAHDRELGTKFYDLVRSVTPDLVP